jgi:glycerophosphoryl diester phosphodiesterase
MRSVRVRPRRLPPATGFGFLDDSPPGSVLGMAHRGGAAHPDNQGLENTLRAFQHASELGYRYLETDVHATRDGVVVAFHDERLERVTDGVGAIADLTAAELRSVLVQGAHPVPTLAELFEAFPHARFNIDLKSDAVVGPLVNLLEEHEAWDRVLICSFSWRRLRDFRRLSRGRAATAGAPAEAALFRLLPSARVADLLTRGQVHALQVPVRVGPLTVATRGLVRRAHAAGKHVHVWTVDSDQEIRALLDLGVDGVISDRTDVLKAVLAERRLWREP